MHELEESLSKDMAPKLGSEGGAGFGQVQRERKNISNGFTVGKEFRKLQRSPAWIKAFTLTYKWDGEGGPTLWCQSERLAVIDPNAPKPRSY